MDWTEITPNDAGDWLNQRSEEFSQYQAIGAKEGGAVFGMYSGGLKTNRDAWVYNYSAARVRDNVSRMVEFYNSQVDNFAELVARTSPPDPRKLVDGFIDTDPAKFSWNASDKARILSGERYSIVGSHLVYGAYRPFARLNVWADPRLNDRTYQLPSMFPTPRHENYGFTVTGAGSHFEFCLIATDLLPNLHLLDTGQFFARWTYLPLDTDPEPDAEAAAPTLDLFGEAPAPEQSGVVIEGYRRIDNITDATLATYRDWYPGVLPADETAAKDQIFAFVYGLLHAPDYRERFGADLKRSLPRIPRLAAEGFAVFAAAGTRLLDLHLHYEDADPYPLTLTGEVPSGPGAGDLYEWFAVEKLRWAGSGKNADHSTLLYNRRITVAGIPEEAHRYLLGSRSALGWIVDRYQVKTDKASGIVNDPNDWSREVGNPRYILDLIAKVTTVSVETVRIVDSLPPLQIVNP
jgi:predicted helicase